MWLAAPKITSSKGRRGKLRKIKSCGGRKQRGGFAIRSPAASDGGPRPGLHQSHDGSRAPSWWWRADGRSGCQSASTWVDPTVRKEHVEGAAGVRSLWSDAASRCSRGLTDTSSWWGGSNSKNNNRRQQTREPPLSDGILLLTTPALVFILKHLGNVWICLHGNECSCA